MHVAAPFLPSSSSSSSSSPSVFFGPCIGSLSVLLSVPVSVGCCCAACVVVCPLFFAFLFAWFFFRCARFCVYRCFASFAASSSSCFARSIAPTHPDRWSQNMHPSSGPCPAAVALLSGYPGVVGFRRILSLNTGTVCVFAFCVMRLICGVALKFFRCLSSTSSHGCVLSAPCTLCLCSSRCQYCLLCSASTVFGGATV